MNTLHTFQIFVHHPDTHSSLQFTVLWDFIIVVLGISLDKQKINAKLVQLQGIHWISFSMSWETLTFYRVKKIRFLRTLCQFSLVSSKNDEFLGVRGQWLWGEHPVEKVQVHYDSMVPNILFDLSAYTKWIYLKCSVSSYLYTGEWTDAIAFSI